MTQHMTPKQLAESVKRLREDANDPTEAIQTINALVDLVGEMSEAMAIKQQVTLWSDDEDKYAFSKALTKSAPIATLAKEI